MTRSTDTLSRRRLLAGLGAAGLVALPQRTGWARQKRIRKTRSGPLGRTLWLDLDAAPFPFRTMPYTDRTVIVFIPRGWQAPVDGRVDLLFFFHGHLATADDAIRTKRLREQLVASGRRSILIVPQLALNARDSHAGRLETTGGLDRLVRELLEALGGRDDVPAGLRAGRVELAAHSGGFQAAALCVARGHVAIDGVYLFDALYGYASVFVTWLRADPRRRLISYYRDRGKVRKWTHRLQRALDARKIAWRHEAVEGSNSRDTVASTPVLMIVSRVEHVAMPFGNNALRDCLLAAGGSWAGQTAAPRPIDATKGTP